MPPAPRARNPVQAAVDRAAAAFAERRAASALQEVFQALEAATGAGSAGDVGEGLLMSWRQQAQLLTHSAHLSYKPSRALMHHAGTELVRETSARRTESPALHGGRTDDAHHWADAIRSPAGQSVVQSLVNLLHVADAVWRRPVKGRGAPDPTPAPAASKPAPAPAPAAAGGALSFGVKLASGRVVEGSHVAIVPAAGAALDKVIPSTKAAAATAPPPQPAAALPAGASGSPAPSAPATAPPTRHPAVAYDELGGASLRDVVHCAHAVLMADVPLQERAASAAVLAATCRTLAAVLGRDARFGAHATVIVVTRLLRLIPSASDTAIALLRLLVLIGRHLAAAGVPEPQRPLLDSFTKTPEWMDHLLGVLSSPRSSAGAADALSAHTLARQRVLRMFRSLTSHREFLEVWVARGGVGAVQTLLRVMPLAALRREADDGAVAAKGPDGRTGAAPLRQGSGATRQGSAVARGAADGSRRAPMQSPTTALRLRPSAAAVPQRTTAGGSEPGPVSPRGSMGDPRSVVASVLAGSDPSTGGGTRATRRVVFQAHAHASPSSSPATAAALPAVAHRSAPGGSGAPSGGAGRDGTSPAPTSAVSPGSEEDTLLSQRMVGLLMEECVFFLWDAFRAAPALVGIKLAEGRFQWLRSHLFAPDCGIAVGAALLLAALAVYPPTAGSIMAAHVLADVQATAAKLHPSMLLTLVQSQLGRFRPADAWMQAMLRFTAHPGPRCVAALVVGAQLFWKPPTQPLPAAWTDLLNDVAGSGDSAVVASLQVVRFVQGQALLGTPSLAWSPTSPRPASPPAVAIVVLDLPAAVQMANMVRDFLAEPPYRITAAVVTVSDNAGRPDGAPLLVEWESSRLLCGALVLVSPRLWDAWCRADIMQGVVEAALSVPGGSHMSGADAALHVLMSPDLRVVLTPLHTELTPPHRTSDSAPAASLLSTLLDKAAIAPMDACTGSTEEWSALLTGILHHLGMWASGSDESLSAAGAAAVALPPRNLRFEARKSDHAHSDAGGGRGATAGMCILPIVPGLVDGAAHVKAVTDQQAIIDAVHRFPFVRVDSWRGVDASLRPATLPGHLPHAHLLHFSGHGSIHQPLVFGARGPADFDAARLLAAVASPSPAPTLFVLMGCYSGGLAYHLAAAAAAAGRPLATVCWATELIDEARATSTFLAALYGALFAGVEAQLHAGATEIGMGVVVAAFHAAVSRLQDVEVTGGGDLLPLCTLDPQLRVTTQEDDVTVHTVPVTACAHGDVYAQPCGVPCLVLSMPSNTHALDAPWLPRATLQAMGLARVDDRDEAARSPLTPVAPPARIHATTITLSARAVGSSTDPSPSSSSWHVEARLAVDERFYEEPSAVAAEVTRLQSIMTLTSPSGAGAAEAGEVPALVRPVPCALACLEVVGDVTTVASAGAEYDGDGDGDGEEDGDGGEVGADQWLADAARTPL